MYDPDSVRRQYPTLFFSLYKDESFLSTFLKTNTNDERDMTAVRVTTSSDSIKVKQADGSTRRFVVPEFNKEMLFLGKGYINRGKSIDVLLEGATHQSFIIEIPDFFVNGKRLEAGVVTFNYEEYWRPGLH